MRRGVAASKEMDVGCEGNGHGAQRWPIVRARLRCTVRGSRGGMAALRLPHRFTAARTRTRLVRLYQRIASKRLLYDISSPVTAPPRSTTVQLRVSS